MGKIQLLDHSTIDKIAAGEVVSNPSSVVKELMENSIDAGATMISVEIENGGLSLIRISDNGSGIPKEDVKNAFLRHSTSKISKADDLLSVSFLGFRGEALSSIAAVSQVEMITKVKDSITAVRYCIEGGEKEKFQEVGAPEGTTVIVRNIFFNTPARRKFLKSPQTEAGYVSSIVEKIALSHPEISVNFINSGQTKLHTFGNGNLKDVIYNIYGRDVLGNLLEVNFKNDDISINGFIGNASISRGNRGFENYFINGRYIKNNIISNAIEEGYKSVLMQHKYPFTVLHFTINQKLLDVNVHPAKMEARLLDGMEIYTIISETIRGVIMGNLGIVGADIEKENNQNKKLERAPEPFEKARNEAENKKSQVSSEKNNAESSKVKSDNFESEDNLSDAHGQLSYKELFLKDISKVEENTEPQKIYGDEKEATSEVPFLSDTAKKKHRIVGQIFDTYWIVEYEDKMYIIDQHAAHEKVKYEQLMKNLKEKKVQSQMINPPIILNLSMSEAALVDQYIDNFREVGYEIEAFGGQDYVVRAIPSDMYSLDDKDLLMDIIDNLSLESVNMRPDMVTEKIASMSCKAAVKGNTKLSFEEAKALIDQLLLLENPYNCPHGRPTIISMEKRELEKKFKRIV